MKKLNVKRLDNRGFTLIELLAVIVILAIVMGISATSVLNSINNSRMSSLHSTAQNAANTLNTWVAEDMLVTNNADKKLGDNFVSSSQTGDWMCLGTIGDINNRGTAASLAKALSLSAEDLKLTGAAPTLSNGTYNITITSTCSALRYNSSTGGYEILLVAVNGGKYYVSTNGTNGANNFAFSRASGTGVKLTD